MSPSERRNRPIDPSATAPGRTPARDGRADETDRQSAEQMTAVLARIVAELEEVARRIDRNQATIASAAPHARLPRPASPQAAEPPTPDAAYVMAMQDADLSAQRIAGVAGFLRALANASPPEWRVDTNAATKALTLDQLVNAIGNESHAQTGQPQQPGNVELF